MTTASLSTAWTEQAPHQTALEALQRLRWSVFPLDEEKKPPKMGGVHPDGTPKRLRWKPLQSRHPTEQEILFWQATYHPSAWAVITGAISGLIILDFDGEEGSETRRRLGLEPHVQTGSGGHHVYFKHPGWRVPTLNSKSKVALFRRFPGLDIRGEGGYAAFCGRNTHGPYIWKRDPILEDCARLPEDLRVLLGLLHPPSEAQTAQKGTQAKPAESISETLLARALHLVTHARKGRNDTGFWLACQLRDHGYSEGEAHTVMQQYAERVPSTNSKGQPEPYTGEEARSSVKSAYSGAVREAWAGAEVRATPAAGASGGQGTGSPTTATTSSPEPDGRPDIFVGEDQLRDFTDAAIAAMRQQEQKNPTLFLQAARLVRVARNEVGRPLVVQMGVVEVREVLTQAANFYRRKKVAGAEEDSVSVPCSPPKELAEQILARQTQRPYLPFPPLVALVETPVIRPDGTILDQPGYDAPTRLYYAPQPGMEACTVPKQPTTQDCQAALEVIWDIIGEFPYASAADRANTLALLLTPLVRPAIKRHVPLALIDAPKQGTGKGLLSDVVSIAATGSNAAILTLSESEEELQKAITSLLIEGATIITIDNIQGRLQSKHLDAVLTSDIWRGRILGQSKMAQVPQRATWIATGNNIRLGGDLARRCYRIRLDPKMSRPWMRSDFRHSDLATWVLEHRAALICALLTLARAWFVAGCPTDARLPKLGTFTGWVNVVGGILAFAGIEGFLANLEQLYDEADEDSAQWEGFLKAWHGAFGEAWVKIADIVTWVAGEETAEESDEDAGSSSFVAGSSGGEFLPDSLQMALRDHPKSFKIRLGRALEKRIDTCFGNENLHMERDRNGHEKISVWRVVAGSAGSAGSSPSHARNENWMDEVKGGDPQNESERWWNNSPHSPQQDIPQNAQNGLTSHANTHCDVKNDGHIATDEQQLPADGDERERFAL